MELKKIAKIPFYCFSTETTLTEIGKYVRTKAHELYQGAVNSNLEITGPVYWVYSGMDGNPTSSFKLEIGIPIHTAKSTTNTDFSCKELPASSVLSHTHYGNWNKLADTYTMLFTELSKLGLTHNGICREIYTYIDFNNPENNCTEVQIGYL